MSKKRVIDLGMDEVLKSGDIILDNGVPVVIANGIAGTTVGNMGGFTAIRIVDESDVMDTSEHKRLHSLTPCGNAKSLRDEIAIEAMRVLIKTNSSIDGVAFISYGLADDMLLVRDTKPGKAERITQ